MGTQRSEIRPKGEWRTARETLSVADKGHSRKSSDKVASASGRASEKTPHRKPGRVR